MLLVQTFLHFCNSLGTNAHSEETLIQTGWAAPNTIVFLCPLAPLDASGTVRWLYASQKINKKK